MLCAIAAPSITLAVMVGRTVDAREVEWRPACGASAGASAARSARLLLRRAPIRSGFFLDELKENLVLADHSQLAARALLYGVQADLEVAHFGVQRRIAQLQPAVRVALRPDLPLDVPDAQPAALAQPEGILDEQYQPCQGKREEPHRSW